MYKLIYMYKILYTSVVLFYIHKYFMDCFAPLAMTCSYFFTSKKNFTSMTCSNSIMNNKSSSMILYFSLRAKKHLVIARSGCDVAIYSILSSSSFLCKVFRPMPKMSAVLDLFPLFAARFS